MISNPTKLSELMALGIHNLKEHRPKVYQELQKSGQLEEFVNSVSQLTLSAYMNEVKALLKNGYAPNQAHETAWERVREEWLLRPSEEQPELEEL